MPRPSRYSKLTPRQVKVLVRLLHRKNVSRCAPSALASLAWRGFTLGEGGGHAMTTVGRQVAESCQALPEGAWRLLDRVDLSVSVLAACPQPPP